MAANQSSGRCLRELFFETETGRAIWAGDEPSLDSDVDKEALEAFVSKEKTDISVSRFDEGGFDVICRFADSCGRVCVNAVDFATNPGGSRTSRLSPDLGSPLVEEHCTKLQDASSVTQAN